MYAIQSIVVTKGGIRLLFILATSLLLLATFFLIPVLVFNLFLLTSCKLAKELIKSNNPLASINGTSLIEVWYLFCLQACVLGQRLEYFSFSFIRRYFLTIISLSFLKEANKAITLPDRTHF